MTAHAMTRLFDRHGAHDAGAPPPATAYSEDVERTVVATPDLWARISKLANHMTDDREAQDGTSD
jgi:hypothetical protein